MFNSGNVWALAENGKSNMATNKKEFNFFIFEFNYGGKNNINHFADHNRKLSFKTTLTDAGMNNGRVLLKDTS